MGNNFLYEYLRTHYDLFLSQVQNNEYSDKKMNEILNCIINLQNTIIQDEKQKLQLQHDFNNVVELYKRSAEDNERNQERFKSK